MLALERFVFLCQIFETMAYEAVLLLTFLCIRALCARLRRCQDDASRRRPVIVSLAAALIFPTLATLGYGADVVANLEAYVDNRNPTPVLVTNVPSVELGNICALMIVLLADGLLLWRASIIWNAAYRIMIIPFLVFTGLAAMSVAYVYGVFHPNASPFNGDIIYLIYGAVAITDNLILTSLIVGRLLFFNWRIKKSLGNSLSGDRPYVSIAAIMVESALPYTIATITYLVVYSLSRIAAVGFFSVLIQIAALSPLLILWRVATGTAINGSGSTSHRSDSNGEQMHRSVPLTALRFQMRNGSSVDNGQGADVSEGIDVDEAITRARSTKVPAKLETSTGHLNPDLALNAV